MATDWTRDEVERIVADYFGMLRAELSGQTVNKAEHNRKLQRLIGRSKGSIEFKHANISAVLRDLGDLPQIDGYKPRSNYQQLLEQVVLEWISGEPDFFDKLARGPIVQPASAPPTDFGDVEALLEDAPEPLGEPGTHIPDRREETPRVQLRRTDFVRLDAENRKLGQLGEQWVMEFEARRLTDLHRRPDLANRVVWVARDQGDGAGFDIKSFNHDETPRLIEVKTTGLTKYHPFFVSPRELAVSEREATAYYLYRVFTFAKAPRLFTLRGALSSICRLEPAQYLARFAK